MVLAQQGKDTPVIDADDAVAQGVDRGVIILHGGSNDPFGEFGFFGLPNTVDPNVDNFACIGQGTMGRDSAYGANVEAERRFWS